MKRIILGIFVSMLLIATIMPTLNAVSEVKKYGHEQHLNVGWIKHFEGTSWGHNVIQTSDGGYLVAGGTDYSGSSDALLIKTDLMGNIQWKKELGSLGWDAFEGLCELSEGNFVASGIDSGKGFLVKIDPDGEIIWQKQYGDSTDCYFIDLIETSDGCLAMSGYYFPEGASSSDAWFMKTDIDGNEIWSFTYGIEGKDSFHSLSETSDYGFILCGWKSGPALAIKIDSSGNIEWEKTYESISFLHSGMETSDGGYIFTGGGPLHSSLLYKLGIGGFSQIFLLKTDSQGNELWIKDFGFFSHELGMWVEETEDEGFILIGNYLGIGVFLNKFQNNHFFPLWSKIWIIKTDSDGNHKWDKKIETGFGRCVRQTTDGGFILTGQRGAYNIPKGVLLIKTDENGNINISPISS